MNYWGVWGVNYWGAWGVNDEGGWEGNNGGAWGGDNWGAWGVNYWGAWRGNDWGARQAVELSVPKERCLGSSVRSAAGPTAWDRDACPHTRWDPLCHDLHGDMRLHSQAQP